MGLAEIGGQGPIRFPTTPWKEACNYLVTARRAFQRLLRQEIGVYASSEEEIASEVRDLFHFAAGG